MSNYFNVYEEQGLTYFQLPKIFFTDEKYKEMRLDSKVVWSILKDRFQVSVKNNWFDENGNIFFIYTNEDLMEILDIKSKSTFQKIKKELLEADLLNQTQIGLNKPNKLYLKKPIASTIDVNSNQKIKSNPLSGKEVQKSNFQKYKNRTSRSTKNVLPEVQKMYSSKNNLSKNNLSKNNKDQSVEYLISQLDIPQDIKNTLNKYQKRLIDDDISLMDIESNYKAHRELLTVGEYQSALNFVLAKFERPIASIEAAMRTAVIKKLELRKQALESNKPKEDTMPKWYKEEQETAAVNEGGTTSMENNNDNNLEIEKAHFQEMLEQRRERQQNSSSL